MQLKAVVFPAPLGPIRPTISNSSTFRLTSERAWSPPKRIDSSTASRRGIDTLGGHAALEMHLEALTLQPPADRRRDRAEAVGLEDQGEDRQEAREGGDDVDGVVLEKADRASPVGQVLATQDVQQGEDHDAPPTPQAPDDGDDEVGQGHVGEGEVDGDDVAPPGGEEGAGDSRI